MSGADELDDSLNIETADGTSTAAWDAFVQAHNRGTPYHTIAWRRVIERVFRHETFYLSATAGNGDIEGVLPLVRLKSLMFGDFLVSIPYVNYGGALAVGARADGELMREACELGRRLGARHVEFRDAIQRPDEWPCRTDKVIMERALPKDADELLRDLGSKVRAQIKRPTKEGATVVHGGRELLSEFYATFARNMRDLGTPVYPRKFFSVICELLPAASRIVVVRIGGQPVAAGFLLKHRQRMEIPWASSMREYNRLGVNMLLYGEALKLAINEGCTTFDFGRSSVGSGTFRFKKQWGAAPKQLYWHYWLRSGGPVPQLSPSNPKYRMAISIWQHLPLELANLLGPRIVKYLP